MNDTTKHVHVDPGLNCIMKMPAGRAAIMNRREEVGNGRVRWLTRNVTVYFVCTLQWKEQLDAYRRYCTLRSSCSYTYIHKGKLTYSWSWYGLFCNAKPFYLRFHEFGLFKIRKGKDRGDQCLTSWSFSHLFS